MNNENPVIRRPIRITRAHHTDLVCAAMNDTTGASQKILDRMTEDPGFQIDSCPPELFALQAQDPIPSEDGTLIDPDQKPKPSPSGLLMRLMSRL